MSSSNAVILVPILALVLLLFFRTGIFVFYLFAGIKRKERSMWGVLAYLWGAWSIPFWYMLYRLDLLELERDFKKFKLIKWIFDRSSVLNTLGVYFGAQAVSVFSLVPLLIVLLLARYQELSLDHIMRPWALLLIIIYLNITVALIIYLWAYRSGHIDLKTLGLERKGAVKWVFVGFGLGILLLAGAGIGQLLFGQLIPTDVPAFLNPEQDIFGTKSVVNYIMILVAAGIIAPIGEELFFRGYMYTSISRKNSPYYAMIVTSLIFAAWHLNIILLPVIVAAALIINFVRYKTGSIIPCIVIHMMNNILAVSLLYWFN